LAPLWTLTEILDFLAMGGYAGFVWPAYAIALATLGGLAVQSVCSLRALRREVAALEETQPARGVRGRARPNPKIDASA